MCFNLELILLRMGFELFNLWDIIPVVGSQITFGNFEILEHIVFFILQILYVFMQVFLHMVLWYCFPF